MNPATKHTLLLSMLAGLAVSANTWGQTHAPPGSTDSNADGVVSMREHDAGAQAMFERMDANHDGALTAAEIDAGHAKMMKDGEGMHRGHQMPGMDMGTGMGPGMPANGMLAMMDGNHDGAVTAQEHAAGAKAMFDKMDANHDGKVTAAEMAAGHAMMMKDGGGMHRGHGRPGMDKGAGMRHRMSSADLIARMDRNGDGKVSAAEHLAGARAMFNESDTNKDGNLSGDEIAAHHAAMMRHDMGQHHGKDVDKAGSEGEH